MEMSTMREEGTGACACAPDPSADISENHGEEEDSVTGAYLNAFSGGSPGGTPEVVPAPASAPAQFASWDRYAHAQSEDSPVLPPPSPFSSGHATAHDDGQEAEDADLTRCEDEHDLAQREDEDDLEAEHHAQYLSVSPHASPSGSAASSPSITFAFPWGVSGGERFFLFPFLLFFYFSSLGRVTCVLARSLRPKRLRARFGSVLLLFVSFTGSIASFHSRSIAPFTSPLF
jgi:hypothetical protein